ncbi:MAG TPA: dodecin family protein [Nannocystaceae bacterium]|nr:dodecin family protein [Nannocystaceae bacterium]
MYEDYRRNGQRFEMRDERDEYRDRGSRSRDEREYDDRDHGGYDHRGSRAERARDEYEPRQLGNSLASVWEVTAQSRDSFDDAIRYGIDRARRSLRHIRGAWVQGQEVLLRNGEIYAYRVQLKVTYVLDDR